MSTWPLGIKIGNFLCWNSCDNKQFGFWGFVCVCVSVCMCVCVCCFGFGIFFHNFLVDLDANWTTKPVFTSWWRDKILSPPLHHLCHYVNNILNCTATHSWKCMWKCKKSQPPTLGQTNAPSVPKTVWQWLGMHKLWMCMAHTAGCLQHTLDWQSESKRWSLGERTRLSSPFQAQS